MIQFEKWKSLKKEFKKSEPYNHVIIDNFFQDDFAIKIAQEFPKFDSDVWGVLYNNPLENKKGCSHWDKFPKHIYQAIYFLTSRSFVKNLEKMTGIKNLYADVGLHGAGLHTHKSGGHLNVHLDYNIHPKLRKQRKLNLIVYVSENWDLSWGGDLELWSHDSELKSPKECIKKVNPIFNRAVIFDTTQNSWHGLPEVVNCSPDRTRNSLAIYYLAEPKENEEDRNRAFFAPNKYQKDDQEVLDFIKKRSSL